VGSVDHVNSSGDCTLDKPDVAGSLRQAVGAKPDPRHVDITQLCGSDHSVSSIAVTAMKLSAGGCV
jgi:hypothetical protein